MTLSFGRHGFGSSSWGDYSWSLHGGKGGRSGFFIHGGTSWGSIGCIDIKSGDSKLHDFLSSFCDCFVPVTVSYSVKKRVVTETGTPIQTMPPAPTGLF